jgi:hypothetical protein
MLAESAAVLLLTVSFSFCVFPSSFLSTLLSLSPFVSPSHPLCLCHSPGCPLYSSFPLSISLLSQRFSTLCLFLTVPSSCLPIFFSRSVYSTLSLSVSLILFLPLYLQENLLVFATCTAPLRTCSIYGAP